MIFCGQLKSLKLLETRTFSGKMLQKLPPANSTISSSAIRNPGTA